MENDAGPSEPRSNLLTDALVSIWHQVMVDSKDRVEMGAGAYPVTKTSSKRLTYAGATAPVRAQSLCYITHLGFSEED